MTSTRPATRLTASATGELDLARTHLRALVEAATRLVGAAGHDPDRVACEHAACGLAAVDDGPSLCALAHRLDLLAPDMRQSRGPTELAPALADFRRALLESLDAVRACRSTAHAEGHCWFASSPGDDLCGEVLRAAHRAG